MAKSNIKHKKYFVDAWLEDPLFTGWLCKVKSNSTKARCLACEKDIELSTMGRSALKEKNMFLRLKEGETFLIQKTINLLAVKIVTKVINNRNHWKVFFPPMIQPKLKLSGY